MIRRLIPLALVAAPLLASTASIASAQTRGDFRYEKALAAGKEVEVRNVSGDIKVVPSTNGKVEVVGIKRGRGDVDLLMGKVEETSHGIIVCVLYDDPKGDCDDNRSSRSRRGDRNWNDASMNFEVSVPTNLTVSASSVSGDVAITGAQGDVNATTVSGDIRLDRPHASSITAHSVSGDVTLELPSQLDADISMSTVSGDLNSDYPITLSNGRMSRRSIQARIGKGGRRLELNTVSGDVRIKKIN